MKVLVTGGMGYIGSHTCIALHQAGYTPVIYDNLSNASVKVIDQLAQITGHHFDYIVADIGDKDALSAAINDHHIQAVFHFAALKAVGESTEQPIRYYQNNVAKTLTMIEVMSELNVKKLIFSSSATVYGDPQYLPIDEQHPISSTNPYGWSKVMVEQALNDLAASDGEWLTIALRYFNPVGADKSGLIGESPKGIPNNLMPFIAQTAVGRREHVSVFGDDYDTPDGTGVRDYIHISDLADGHVAAFSHHFNHEQAGTGSYAYNLGTGEGYSVLEMIKAFSVASGVDIPYQLAPRRSGDIACNYADASLAKQGFGWQAKRDINAMTADTWRWQTNYPNGLDE
ncbi:UDP-glucose 4-epimerase GalE [Thalassotalea euphylliae]|uniref:UDP-glucose 4-epimerase n=1 Tax=Thalassotalea euphylliae TaxID=1655234 RepID=A0A3E0TMQ6_9GAMM|nr:UDP-glucose 4-epimerase GalE [Thalassotalea euphylliae]REL25627.1 UDP-glucose 4-epimerase GalE [Thalassotalea euphylliae]